MATELNPKPIACIAKALVDGVELSKHFMLHQVLDEDDTDMVERARRRAHQVVSFGGSAKTKVSALHVTFL